MNEKEKSKKTKNSKGITIIALVITIIVLIILASVSISLVLGDQGIIKKSVESQEKYSQEQVKEDLEMKLSDIIVYNIGEHKENEIRDCEKLKEKNTEIEIEYEEEYAIVTYKDYMFEIDSNLKIVDVMSIKDITDINMKNRSVLGKIARINNSGVQKIKVNGVEYSLNVIYYSENLVLDGIEEVSGATLTDNVYEFGNAETDVATSTTDYAKNMVVLKVDGDLTINEGITLTSCKNADGYGGPKGMFIYCKGTLTNNGTISMTARGAYAEGEDIFLYKNIAGTYEYVPSIGASGGNSKTGSGDRVTRNKR